MFFCFNEGKDGAKGNAIFDENFFAKSSINFKLGPEQILPLEKFVDDHQDEILQDSN